MSDAAAVVLCPYCPQLGALVIPVIAPAELAAAPWDHHWDCPNRRD